MPNYRARYQSAGSVGPSPHFGETEPSGSTPLRTRPTTFRSALTCAKSRMRGEVTLGEVPCTTAVSWRFLAHRGQLFITHKSGSIRGLEKDHEELPRQRRPTPPGVLTSDFLTAITSRGKIDIRPIPARSSPLIAHAAASADWNMHGCPVGAEYSGIPGRRRSRYLAASESVGQSRRNWTDPSHE